MNGTLSAGEALPSMRALAKDLHISVITVQRAYEDLTRDGLSKPYREKVVLLHHQIKNLFKKNNYE